MTKATVVVPVDWDQESYCCNSDGNPATHRELVSMAGDTPVYELICCSCASRRRSWTDPS